MTVRSAVLPRAFVASRRRHLRRPGRRAALTAAVALLLGGAGWLWLRQSSLVSVDHVTVTGLHGADSGRIREALAAAAGDMTTLDLDPAQLRSAVASFPAVAGLSVSSHPPHAVTIVVRMSGAVAVATYDGQAVAVGADGTLLNGVSLHGQPRIRVDRTSVGRVLGDRHALDELAIAAAIPDPLRRHVGVIWKGPRGLSAHLRDGPDLFFGTTERLAAKWAAVSRVLADPASAGASYLDVTVPERVGAGGLEPTATLNP